MAQHSTAWHRMAQHRAAQHSVPDHFVLPQQHLHCADVPEALRVQRFARALHLLYARAEGAEHAVGSHAPRRRGNDLQAMLGGEVREVGGERMEWYAVGPAHQDGAPEGSTTGACAARRPICCDELRLRSRLSCGRPAACRAPAPFVGRAGRGTRHPPCRAALRGSLPPLCRAV